MQSFKPSDLFNSVCFLASPDPMEGGQGIFIRPDIIVTAAHVIKKPDIIFAHNTKGDIATIVPGSVVADEVHDLAMARISVPLSDRDVPFVTEKSLLGNRGYLMTRFNEERLPVPDVSVHETLFVPELRILDDFARRFYDGEYRTYKTDALVRAGYSGSPIFNEKGEFSSVVSSAKKVYGHNEPKMVPLHPDGHYWLPDSRVVAKFLRQNLG